MEKNWFTIKKIQPDIWGLGEFKHFEEVISYLFVGERNALLFDSGMGIGDIRKEIRKITNLPVKLINSHQHFDHIGGNRQFKDILSSDRKLISIPPFKFKVIHTPGHTPDSICLYESKRNILLTGDTMYPGPIYLFFPESDFSAYKQSIQNLVKLNVTTLLPSHNSFYQDKKILEITEKIIKNKQLSNHKAIKIDNNVTIIFKNPAGAKNK